MLELEEWGALFDRTKDGLILQRDFGGHRYARLAHVGDRTGLEMIRTLQQHAVHKGIDVYMECTLVTPPQGRRPGLRRLRLLARDGEVRPLQGEGGRAGHRRHRQGLEDHLQLLGVHRRRRWRMALEAGADLIDMECVQFHPTGMVWPPSVRGILVTEGVRGDGGMLRNTTGERFMFDYIPELLHEPRRRTPRRGRRAGTPTRATTAARPTCCRATRWRAPSTPRSKAGRGTPHGGVFLDIATRRDAEYIKRRLPSMYHQFKELADVDITKEPMEVGPTCHYMMGGVRVDAETAGHRGARPLRRGRGRGRDCTAPTGWAATRSPTCSSSAGAPGRHAAEYAEVRSRRAERSTRAGRCARARGAARPFERRRAENPYAHPRTTCRRLHAEPGRHHPHRGTSWSRRCRSIERAPGAG